MYTEYVGLNALANNVRNRYREMPREGVRKGGES